MKVKKIAALAVGAAMIGATLGMASAGGTLVKDDSANIPKDFFVKNGEPNVKIVIGTQAAAQDVAGAADIAVALGSLLYTEKEVTTAPLTDLSVVVKKDVSHIGDIPVYSNYYEYTGTQPTAQKWEDLTGNYWYNGAAYSTDYSGWVTNNFPYDLATLTNQSDIVVGGHTYGVSWNFIIDKIQFLTDDGKEWNETYSYPPSASNVLMEIPANAFKIVMNYEIYKWTKTENTTDPVWGTTETTTDTVVSDAPVAGYTQDGTVIDGVGVGDTIQVLDKTLNIIDIGSDTNGDFVKAGETATEWIPANSSKTFGDYQVSVVDIDMISKEILVEVKNLKTGESEQNVLSDTSTNVPFLNDQVEITVEGVFTGLNILKAKLKVTYNIQTIYDGDKISGWVVDWTGVNTTAKTLKGVVLTYPDAIKGKVLNIETPAVKYKITYNVEKYSKDINNDGTNELAVDIWLSVDYAQPKYEYKDLSDVLSGWQVDLGKSKATFEGIKTLEIVPPASPITVLDTNVTLSNVTSNLILVGGPVVNKVTEALADALGVPKDYNGWKSEIGEGNGVIVYKAQCDKIGGHGVVLVAGTDRDGTQVAAEALMARIAELAKA
ncbi:S-layer protein [Thermococcus atlanticus]